MVWFQTLGRCLESCSGLCWASCRWWVIWDFLLRLPSLCWSSLVSSSSVWQGLPLLLWKNHPLRLTVCLNIIRTLRKEAPCLSVILVIRFVDLHPLCSSSHSLCLLPPGLVPVVSLGAALQWHRVCSLLGSAHCLGLGHHTVGQNVPVPLTLPHVWPRQRGYSSLPSGNRSS